ncbi:MAG: dienelactone hydrolase family protein [Bryobacteraceae bacterium]|jgi:carboxymethylenebutenolidase
MTPLTEYVTLSVAADGTSMRAYVARPSGIPKAGLIVFQEAFGVNPHIRDVAERFAREGYLAIAPEMFHRTAPGLEAGYTDFGAVAEHMQALTDPGLEADARAAWDWLKNRSGFPDLAISAVGYCMGGRCACLASIILPLACGVSYYGGGIAPSTRFPGLTDRLNDLQAPMLFFWASLDRHIGPDQVQAVKDALREAKKPFVNVEFSFADHGFFCDARASYNAEAAAEAWALTLAFLNRHA